MTKTEQRAETSAQITSPIPTPDWARETAWYTEPWDTAIHYDQIGDDSLNVQAIIERCDVLDADGADEGPLTVGLYVGTDKLEFPAQLTTIRDMVTALADAADRLAAIIDKSGN